MPPKLSKLEFIIKSNKVHNNRYIYDNVDYINSMTKINIKCPDHGYFMQTPSNHLHGYGCKLCGFCKNTRLSTTTKFIISANKKHNGFYDYKEIEYVNNYTKVFICCPIHGDFEQTPNSHLNGSGCPTCGLIKSDKNRTTSNAEFIKRAKKVHNNFYDYSKTQYEHNTKKVEIICPMHGIFAQNANSHVKGSGCPKCGNNNYSKVAIRWLEKIAKKEQIDIQHAENDGEYIIPDTKYKVDGYCKTTNTVYEFYGDKWHGNLNIYEPEKKCHPFNNKSAGELNNETVYREEVIRRKGYNIVTIWESSYHEYGN